MRRGYGQLSGREVVRPHLTGARVLISAHGSLEGFYWMVLNFGFGSQGHSPGCRSVSHESKVRSKQGKLTDIVLLQTKLSFPFVFHSVFFIILCSSPASLLLDDADRAKALRERETGRCAPISCRVKSQSQVI